eukprot:1186134-Prorocentrum_minimum.AAC.1
MARCLSADRVQFTYRAHNMFYNILGDSLSRRPPKNTSCMIILFVDDACAKRARQASLLYGERLQFSPAPAHPSVIGSPSRVRARSVHAAGDPGSTADANRARADPLDRLIVREPTGRFWWGELFGSQRGFLGGPPEGPAPGKSSAHLSHVVRRGQAPSEAKCTTSCAAAAPGRTPRPPRG